MDGVNVFRLFGELALNGVDEAERELNDLSATGEETRSDLALSFQDMGAKAGELGKNLALGLAAGVAALVALVEGTRELRQDLGKLETSFILAGHGSTTAEKTFKELYGVLGEDDTAIEAANHLSLLADNEAELEEWTNILTGVYATFGDSLPLEGLAEAANETAKVGQVTGPLADAINWLGISEEEFNKQLAECNSEAEREALIRETLTGLYGDAATSYKKVNKGVIDNNKAQAEMNLKLADAAKKVEPIITKGKLLLADVLEKITPVLGFIIDNINILGPIVLGFLGTLFALNIASKVSSFIKVVATLNATMAANPIGLIITAIGLLVTAFITLWMNCEEFREFWINLWNNIMEVLGPIIDSIVEIFKAAWEYIKAVWDAVQPYFSAIFEGIKAVFSRVVEVLGSYFEMAWTYIKFIWDTVTGYFAQIWETIKGIFSVVKDVLSGNWQGAWDGIKKIVGGWIGYFKGIWDGIKGVFGKVGDFFGTVFGGAWNKVKNIFSTGGKIFMGIVDGIKSAFTSIVNAIIKGINKVVAIPFNGINKALKKIRDVNILGVEPFKGLIKLVDVPQIPLLWQGGVLEKGQTGLLEGNGAEAVVPLHNNKKWINAVANDMSDAIGTGDNSGVVERLERITDLLLSYFPTLSQRQVMLSTGELVGALVDPMDVALGELADKRRRGR